MPKKDTGVWVAIRVLEGARADGAAGEYCGRISKRAFDQIRTGRDCESLFKLENPFWVGDGGSFVFMGHLKEHGYAAACWFRADAVMRLILLTAPFVKNVLRQMKSRPKPRKSDPSPSERARYSSIA
jgi:hypothetical protein